jgi:hypothetical protein
MKILLRWFMEVMPQSNKFCKTSQLRNLILENILILHGAKRKSCKNFMALLFCSASKQRGLGAVLCLYQGDEERVYVCVCQQTKVVDWQCCGSKTEKARLLGNQRRRRHHLHTMINKLTD